MNRIDMSHDDIRCTIVTPAPLPAGAYPLLERLSRTVTEVAVALADLTGTEEETDD